MPTLNSDFQNKKISDIFHLKMKKNGLKMDGILFEESDFPERYLTNSIPYPEPGIFIGWMGLLNIFLSSYFGLVITTKYNAHCQEQDVNNLLLRFPELKEEIEKLNSRQSVSLSLSLEQAEYFIRYCNQKTKTVLMREKSILKSV